MKTYPVLPGVIQLICSCSIAWFIFSVPKDPFETIVLAALVLIYAQVDFSRSTSAMISSHYSFQLNALFQKIHTEDEELNEIVKTGLEQSKTALPITYVAVANYLILEVIAVWKIISALL